MHMHTHIFLRLFAPEYFDLLATGKPAERNKANAKYPGKLCSEEDNYIIHPHKVFLYSRTNKTIIIFQLLSQLEY